MEILLAKKRGFVYHSRNSHIVSKDRLPPLTQLIRKLQPTDKRPGLHGLDVKQKTKGNIHQHERPTELSTMS